MSISDLNLQKGATGITITGGTATAYQNDGLDVKNGIHVVDTTEANFLLRQHATFKNKAATLQSSGSYSKGIRNFNYTIPYAETDGSISYAVFRGQMDLPATVATAVVLQLRLMATQQIMDAQLDNFHVYGTTA